MNPAHLSIILIMAAVILCAKKALSSLALVFIWSVFPVTASIFVADYIPQLYKSNVLCIPCINGADLVFWWRKKKRHKQLSNEILKPSGFKGKSQTNFNTYSGCPTGIRNSSDFPSTLPRPVRKLTLNHGDIENERGREEQPSHEASPLPSNTHSPIWRRHVELLRVTIQPTTGARGWELVSRDTPPKRMVGLRRQSGTQQVGGRNGSKASWINAEGALPIPGEST